MRRITEAHETACIQAAVRKLMGPDSHLLSSEWLDRPDIYCVPERNDNQGVHFDGSAVVRAMRVKSPSSWYAADVGDPASPQNFVELLTPPENIIPTPGQETLASFYFTKSYLLFDESQTAVILYSDEHEYRLIAGSADFVIAYAKNVNDFVREFCEDMEKEQRLWADMGNQQVAQFHARSLELAMAQVKLPAGP